MKAKRKTKKPATLEDLRVPREVWVPKALRAKKLMNEKTFLENMGWTASRLDRALERKRLFFIEVAGRRYFPAFFADPNLLPRHTFSVLRILENQDVVGKYLFFTQPRGSLGNLTPIQAIKNGKVGTVRDAAMAFVEA